MDEEKTGKMGTGLPLLELLPSELVFAIMDRTPESVLSLMMASKTMKHRTDSYVEQPGSVCIVDVLIVRGSIDTLPTGRFVVSMEVPSKYADLFELRLKRFPPLFRDDSSLEIFRVKGAGIDFDKNIYGVIVDSNDVSEISCLAACMGARSDTSPTKGSIGRVILENCHDTNGRRCVSTMLKCLNFRKLLYRADNIMDEHETYLFNLIDNHAVDHVELEVESSCLADTSAFLRGLAARARSIGIRQKLVQGVPRGANFLLGVHDVNWAFLILDMFAPTRNMKRLHISNEDYPNYLSRLGADDLRKFLPKLGDKLWFCGTCNKYDDRLYYHDSGYSITADDAFQDSRTSGTTRVLRIKHL